MIVNPSTNAILFQQVDTKFRQIYADTPTFYEDMASTLPSSTLTNVYAWCGRNSGMREWLGSRFIDNLAARNYSITNKLFEKTIGISVEEVSDDQFGVFNVSLQELAVAAKQWPDVELAAALEAGTSTTCYDGQYFFYDAHPQNVDAPSGTTFSNHYANVVGGGSVSTALTVGNVQAMRAAFWNFKNDAGKPLGIVPDLLVVPPALELKARQICEAQYIAPATAGGIESTYGTTDNMLKGALRVQVNPYLTSASYWYVMATKRAIKPLVWQLREAPSITAKTADTDSNVFMQHQYLYGARARGAAGYSFPFLCIACSA